MTIGALSVTKPLKFTSPPKADPSPCLTDNCTLTACGDLDGTAIGEAQLTYTWKCLFEPRPVTFSANGTPAARKTTVTFPAPGMYTFECEVRTPNDSQKAVARCSVVVRPYEIEIVEGTSFGRPDTIVRCYDENGMLYAMSDQPGNRPHLVKAVLNLWNDRKRLQEWKESALAVEAKRADLQTIVDGEPEAKIGEHVVDVATSVINRLRSDRARLTLEKDELQKQLAAMADRIAAQSDILSKKAEAPQADE